MNNGIEKNLLYLIKDLRNEYITINNYLSIIDDNQAVIVQSYIDLIINQIKSLENNLRNPDSFSNDLKIIKTYSETLKQYIESLNNNSLYGINIALLNGLVYCDDITYLYVEYINGDSLTRLNLNEEDIVSKRAMR